MRTQSSQRTLHTDYGDIEVMVEHHWESDGIGSYEFWGQRGYDAGITYVEIDEITPIFEPEDTDEYKSNILKFIEDNYDKSAEKFAEQIKKEGTKED